MTSSDPTATPTLAVLEHRINVSFRDAALLRQALCHTSYLNERPGDVPGSNERLEFLGDAILGAIMADWLYRSLPEHSEGDLTVIRSTLVREETLAIWAKQIDLGAHLLLGRGEVLGGGRTRSTLLARAFEALVGAIFLEQGDRAVRDFLWGFFNQEMEQRKLETSLLDAKSRLQHLCQVRFSKVPNYTVVDMGGREHEPVFTCEVFISADLRFQGTGRTKRLAEQDAANRAIVVIQQQDGGVVV
ncbi:MAG: ribonuclease III [Chloroflexota bacterium]